MISIRTGLIVAAAFCAGGWGLLLGRNHLEGRASVLDRLEAPLLDWRFQLAGPRTPPEDVMIVAIDDETVRRAGTHPLPREAVALLVRRLAAAGAKTIALDMLFLDRGPGQADLALSTAIQGARVVVAAAAVFPGSVASSDLRPGSARLSGLPSAARLLWPVSPIDEAGAIGVVNLATDHGGTPRYVPLLVRSESEVIPSLVLRTAAIAASSEPELEERAVRIGGTRTSVDLGYHLPIRFYGPRGTIRTISAQAVLDGADVTLARDRVVLVGATALSTGDTFATPYDPVLPGVEVLATAIGHLWSGAGLVRDTLTRRVDAAAALILPLSSVLLLSLPHIGWGLALATSLLFAWLGFVAGAFAWNYWFAMALPVAAMLPPALSYGAVRLWLDHRAQVRLAAQHQVLRRFHPKLLADKLAANPDFLERPVQQDATLVFLDLGGFTTVSERLGARGTHGLLVQFETLVDEEATHHGGCVLAFMGDGAMIVFGLPAPQADDAARALQAAFGLCTRLRAWFDTLPPLAGGELGIRVGVHHGEVVISRLGPSAHQHITATGDTVNVTSRLLEVAKQHGAMIAISRDCLIAANVSCEDADPSQLLKVSIRGREKPIEVWLQSTVKQARIAP